MKRRCSVVATSRYDRWRKRAKANQESIYSLEGKKRKAMYYAKRNLKNSMVLDERMFEELYSIVKQGDISCMLMNIGYIRFLMVLCRSIQHK